jgi:hypothetical protein
MIDLPLITSQQKLTKRIKLLRARRKARKQKAKRSYSLSTASKKIILKKTGNTCHICGCRVTIRSFQADHVKAHSSSVNNRIDNFLPACSVCNNYRWFYEPEELKWILKLGVWLKTRIEKESNIGIKAAEEFIKYDKSRRQRRKVIK